MYCLLLLDMYVKKRFAMYIFLIGKSCHLTCLHITVLKTTSLLWTCIRSQIISFHSPKEFTRYNGISNFYRLQNEENIQYDCMFVTHIPVKFLPMNLSYYDWEYNILLLQKGIQLFYQTQFIWYLYFIRITYGRAQTTRIAYRLTCNS